MLRYFSLRKRWSGSWPSWIRHRTWWLTALLKCCLNCYIYVWLSWPSSRAVCPLCIQVPATDSRSTFFKLCFLFGSADRQSASVRLGTWPESPTVSYNVNHIPQQHVALFMRELNVCQAYTRLSQRCVNHNTTLKYLCINNGDHFFSIWNQITIKCLS